MKTSKVLAGIVSGLAIGATLGVLFAPDKGEKTRKKIADKTKDAKDKIKENIDGFVEKVSEKISTMKEEGEDLLKSKKEDIKESIINGTKNV